MRVFSGVAGVRVISLVLAMGIPGSSASAVDEKGEGSATHKTPSWAIVVEADVDPQVVTSEFMRRAIAATGLPWRVRHRESGIELLLIPPGEFVMGKSLGDKELPVSTGIFDQPEADPLELPAHRVIITSPFYLGRYEVTEAQWLTIMGDRPQETYKRGGSGPTLTRDEAELRAKSPAARRPIDRVSWEEAIEFCAKLKVRLPTEAEWEYACRAGLRESRYGAIDDIAWFEGNSGGKSRPVGGKMPNALGLHDMLGNVPEWVQDLIGKYPEEDQKDPKGPGSGRERVRRGGGFDSDAYRCRSSSRLGGAPEPPEFGNIGFRIAITPDVPAADLGLRANSTRSSAKTADRPVPSISEWAEVLDAAPDPKVVTDSTLRAAIAATGLPWRVRHKATGVEMLLVPPGSFEMGGHEKPVLGTPFTLPTHEVTLTKAFYLGRYEVKQSEWIAAIGRNPSVHRDRSERGRKIDEMMAEGVSKTQAELATQGLSETLAGLPVDSIDWDDCARFVSEAELRLPTEAEWEYACRAGSTADRYGPIDTVAWHRSNSGMKSHPVGLKRANALGFHDMLGNVSEWVQDWWGRYKDGPQTDPTGPSSGSTRVMRGSGFSDAPDWCTAFGRSTDGTRANTNDWGVRVARDP